MWHVILSLSVWAAASLYIAVALLSVGFWTWMAWMPKRRAVKEEQ